MKISCLAILLGFGLLSGSAAAQVYVGLDHKGELQVSPELFDGAQWLDLRANEWSLPVLEKTVTLGSAVSARRADRGAAPPAHIAEVVEDAADRHGVDAALIHAVIQVESNYRPSAVSPVGAAGLMQLMSPTARRFGVRDRFDVQQNVEGGTAYLKWLSERFSGDLDLVLAAYNAGEGAVAKYGNRIPPYRETQAYVRKVRSQYDSRRVSFTQR